MAPPPPSTTSLALAYCQRQGRIASWEIIIHFAGPNAWGTFGRFKNGNFMVWRSPLD